MKRRAKIISKAFFKRRKGTALIVIKLFRLIALLIFVFTVTANDSFSQTVVSFNEYNDGKKLFNELGSKGIVFPYKAYVIKSTDFPNSCVISDELGNEFDPGPLEIEFLSPQLTVSLLGSTFHKGTKSATLKAFDETGTQIAIDTKTFTGGVYPSVLFEVKATKQTATTKQKLIKRIQFESGASEFEVIDNLTFNGGASGGLAATSLKVKLTTPTANAIPNVYDRIVIEGQVKGLNVTPSVLYKIKYNKDPSDKTKNSRFSYITLVKLSNEVSNFNSSYSGLPPGPITITVIAENYAGKKDSASAIVLNIHPEIIRRLESESSQNASAFKWGKKYSSGEFNLFNGVAIFRKADARTLVMKGKILDKWLLAFDNTGNSILGPPTAEMITLADGVLKQDFENGRIYSTATGSYFIPNVFSEAVDKLGGESVNGYPLSDPLYLTGSVSNDYTFLFQQFKRSDQAGKPKQAVPSTFEIKGVVPKLYIYRVGGDLSGLTDVQPDRDELIATLVDRFDCSGINGPCSIVTSSEETPRLPYERAKRLCGNKNWEEIINKKIENAGLGDLVYLTGLVSFELPPSWVPVSPDRQIRSISGFVKESRLTKVDNPFNHDIDACSCEPCVDKGILGEYSISLGDLSKIVARYANDQTFRICPMDWNIIMIPSKADNYLINEEQTTLEIEYEHVRGMAYWTTYDDPHPGDLIFLSGRWVVDCAHAGYHTEIHPPSIMAVSQTVKHVEKTSTSCAVWVNSYYDGEKTSFDIFPPPRPNSNSIIDIETFAPYKKQEGFYFDIVIKPDRVTVTIEGKKYTPPIGDFGMMKWESGGSNYMCELFVYWTDIK